MLNYKNGYFLIIYDIRKKKTKIVSTVFIYYQADVDYSNRLFVCSVLLFKIINDGKSKISLKILIQTPLVSTKFMSIYYNLGEDRK